jgi:hypothetical protein
MIVVVASPTPMMGIEDDSTTTTRRPGKRFFRARAAK